MQSEHEFLKSYSLADYERPSVTTDIAAFKIRSKEEDSFRHDPESVLSLLLIKRGGHPFKDHWALPGGFLKSSETVEECAIREITEETNVTPAAIAPVGVFSAPGRDPRGWIISNAYASVICDESVSASAGDDADDARWFDVSFDKDSAGECLLTLVSGDVSLKAVLREKPTSFGRSVFEITDSGELAFDHASIIASAITLLRNSAENIETVFSFLPEKFTLAALQKVQETIMNVTVLPANFRRKVSGHVVETDEYTSGAGHRPAKLFTKKI